MGSGHLKCGKSIIYIRIIQKYLANLFLKVTKREEQDREFSGRHLGRQMPKIRLKTAQYRQGREGKIKAKKPHNKRKS